MTTITDTHVKPHRITGEATYIKLQCNTVICRSRYSLAAFIPDTCEEPDPLYGETLIHLAATPTPIDLDDGPTITVESHINGMHGTFITWSTARTRDLVDGYHLMGGFIEAYLHNLDPIITHTGDLLTLRYPITDPDYVV